MGKEVHLFAWFCYGLIIPFTNTYSSQLSDDLVRAQADRATACFLFSNPYTNDPNIVDRETMLKALSIRKFSPSTPIFCQLNALDNKSHVSKIGVKQSFSINELKMVLCN
jgi:hypothetical protein